ncbi:glycosyl hydrolase [Nocardioides sp. P86]|uniref:glycoside hydrolase family 26 protein n=1 Tax=Nocardioides sp. P86 TaxID=2939569 RepID=UPI002041B328|nr:glycosyl hydrolase [Nocardioides sp. P86]MCM3517048.1 hypothetical protein [Nocardioides sp. P86]
MSDRDRSPRLSRSLGLALVSLALPLALTPAVASGVEHPAGTTALPPTRATAPAADPAAGPAAGPAASTAASPAPGTVRAARTAPLVERVDFGAFVPGMTTDPERLADWERSAGTDAAVASYYYGYGDVFPAATEERLADDGARDLLLSWDMGPTRFAEWTAGEHDAYLDQIAAAARAYPHDVYVRPWPEMNGDWQDFQPTAAGERRFGGTFREFRLAWRHVVTHLREAGADNLRWVFNPTADTYAETTPVRRIWPGAAYVDVLGLDGFNWGRDAGWGRWRSFGRIFRAQYDHLVALAPRLPVWICEVASKEPRVDDGAPVDREHSKAAWVRSMLAHRGMPALTTVVWFDERKERDWRLTSSAGTTRAWRTAARIAAR